MRTDNMVTLEDLARQAGVSHSTVSRALADSPLVNAETKKRIRMLAEREGYQVNQVARNLKIRSTRTVGLVVPEVSNPFYPHLIQHIADAVRTAGFSLQLHLSGATQEAESECLLSLRSQRADGILLVTAEQGLLAREQVRALMAMGTPVVVMGWVEGADELDLVTGDDAFGGRELANHLLALGHRRIAVLGKAPHRGPFDRLHGFTAALAEAGYPLADELCLPAQNDVEVGSALRRLMSLPQPPTALFAYQDSLAAQAYRHLHALGVDIPRDLSVVGFDDIDLATFLSPPLTTVGTHIEPLARSFVDLLLRRIQDEAIDPTPHRIVITPRLVVRTSSAPPPAGQGNP